VVMCDYMCKETRERERERKSVLKWSLKTAWYNNTEHLTEGPVSPNTAKT